jgi:phosphatidylinositol dimannoside acyltransferase
MSLDWRLDLAYPLLAKLPTTLPWSIAPLIGREPRTARHAVVSYLAHQMGQCFSQATPDQLHQWAQRHLIMLAYEMVDALAFTRLCTSSGPTAHIAGLQEAQEAAQSKRGAIFVLNHFDRLLTAPVALARHGIKTHVLTMPIADNPDITGSQKRYLLRKIRSYTRATGGSWQTTNQSMRTVHNSLRQGENWIILADAWRPEFTNLRSHPFFGGQLNIPTGIERLAKSTGAQLLHVSTHSQSANQLNILVETLPPDPEQALSAVVQRLEAEIRTHPWAWWQWGILSHFWNPAPKDAL